MSTLTEKLVKEVLDIIPGSYIRNRSVTTSSVYIKTPDGYSMRVGDHKGREKYKYKWNLGPQYSNIRGWRKDEGKWRYYTDRPIAIAMLIEKRSNDDSNNDNSRV